MIIATLCAWPTLTTAGGSAAGPTVGMFTPCAPFPTTAARVDFAAAVGQALGGTGKSFARAADFAAAVKKGEVTLAVVDAAYLAASGGTYTVIAVAVRKGDAAWGWQLVAPGSGRILALAGKRLLVPSVGGREADFVLGALLGSELRRDFFGRIDAAPDSASALAALGLGKADAGVVPNGVELPAGVKVVLTLPSAPGPLLVGYGPISAEQRAALARVAAGFPGDATIAGFRAAEGEPVKALVRRFAPPVRRGPLAVPSAKLALGELAKGRALTIERTPPASFAIAP